MTMTAETQTTTTTTVLTNADELERVLTNGLTFAGTEDTRPILASLNMDFTPVNGPAIEDAHSARVVATDSYTLSVETWSPEVDGQVFSFLLPRQDAMAIVKACKGIRTSERGTTVAAIEHDQAQENVTIKIGTTAFSVRPTVGDFPKYEKLFASDAELAEGPKSPVHVDPVYMARFAKVRAFGAAKAGEKPMSVRYVDSLKPTRVDIGESFRGLIMPVRV